MPDSGFTNKAEAKNLLVKGLKEGTWLEFEDSVYQVTNDVAAPYYMLAVYKDNEYWNVTRRYYKSGKLFTYYPFKNGKLDGVEKWYYESGNIQYTIPFTNGKVNGTKTEYYENGKVKTETTWSNDLITGPAKQYDENGKEIK